MTFALPGTEGSYAVAGRQPESVRAPGADRGPLPHALGDGPRLLRAPRAGARRRAVGVPLPVPRPREAGAGRPRGPGGLVHPHEGGGRRARSAPRWRARRPSASARPRSAIHDRLRAGRQAHHLRQRRLGHRRQRLGDRLRRSAAGTAAGARRCRSRWSRPRSPPSRTTSGPTSSSSASSSPTPSPATSRSPSRPAAARATSSRRSPRRGSAGCSPWRCWAMTAARSGGRTLADHFVVVGSDYIPRIQEVQASIYHVMRESLEELGHEAS